MESDHYRLGYQHGSTPLHPFTPPSAGHTPEEQRAAYVRGFDDGLDDLINRRDTGRLTA